MANKKRIDEDVEKLKEGDLVSEDPELSNEEEAELKALEEEATKAPSFNPKQVERASDRLLTDSFGTDKNPQKYASGQATAEGVGVGGEPLQPEKDTRTIIMETTIAQLFSTDKLSMKTDLTKRQVRAFTKGEIFYAKYKSQSMRMALDYLMQYSISLNRKGRQEMSGIINQSSSGMMDDEAGSGDILQKLLGR